MLLLTLNTIILFETKNKCHIFHKVFWDFKINLRKGLVCCCWSVVVLMQMNFSYCSYLVLSMVRCYCWWGCPNFRFRPKCYPRLHLLNLLCVLKLENSNCKIRFFIYFYDFHDFFKSFSSVLPKLLSLYTGHTS